MNGPAQLPFEFEHRSALSGESFFVADSNREAVQWIDRWPAWPAPVLAVHGVVRGGQLLHRVLRLLPGGAAAFVTPPPPQKQTRPHTHAPYHVVNSLHVIN